MIGFTGDKIEEKYFKHFRNSICLENESAIPLTDEKFQTALIPCAAILKPRNLPHVTKLKYAKNSRRAVRVVRETSGFILIDLFKIHIIFVVHVGRRK